MDDTNQTYKDITYKRKRSKNALKWLIQHIRPASTNGKTIPSKKKMKKVTQIFGGFKNSPYLCIRNKKT